MGYAEEKFGNAKRLVGKRKGGIREALYCAFVQIQPIDPSELPVYLRLEYNSLISDLTSVEPVADEGRVRATIGNLSNQEIEALVRRFREFDEALGR